MKKVFILGAGASADFSPSTYSRGYNLDKDSFKSFPTTNDFVKRAIDLGKFKANYPLVEFIKKNYGLDFGSIEKGVPLNIEELYAKIYELFENTDMKKDPEGMGKIIVLLWSVEDIIKELPQHYSTVYGPCRNYSIFADYLLKTNSSIISFNWDTFLDEALFNTGKWFYETGYGFNFAKIYLDRKGIEKHGRKSPIFLFKPHGSTNWFRYSDHYSSTKDGFTGEVVTDEERSQTFLMLFDKSKIGHPIDRRLKMAENWVPNLKMPCVLDIIYPTKDKSWHTKNNYFEIRGSMVDSIKNADEIIFIGFALKTFDEELFNELQIKKSARIIIINKAAIDKSSEIFTRYKDIFCDNNVEISESKTFEEYCQSLL